MTRWRSAKRPPEGGEDVIVFLPLDGLRLVGWYDIDGQWYVYDQGWTRDVSHWQPLPAPPRARKERKL